MMTHIDGQIRISTLKWVNNDVTYKSTYAPVGSFYKILDKQYPDASVYWDRDVGHLNVTPFVIILGHRPEVLVDRDGNAFYRFFNTKTEDGEPFVKWVLVRDSAGQTTSEFNNLPKLA